MYTVLVADDNVGWLDSLAAALNNEKSFEVVGSARNGKDALDIIQTLQPDIVILDIIMPEFDGAYIVNFIRQNMPEYQPVIYMLSGIGSDTIITILNELDVDFFSMKPISLSLIIKNLEKIISHKGKNQPAPTRQNNPSYDQLVQKVLADIGLPPNLMCTKYTANALHYYRENPESFNMLTKILYPYIAEQGGSTAGSVEKNIRFGIKRMKSENTALYQKVFRYYMNKKITNSIYLNVLSAYLDSIYEKSDTLSGEE